MRLLAPVVVLAVLVAGCAAPAAQEPLVAPTAALETGVAVVVADVGYGPNMYHEAYRRPTWTHHPSTVIPGFPADAPALNLTFGPDYDANVEADRAVWEGLPHGLYWVPGTNVLFYYEGQYETVPPPPHDFLHGTATAGAVVDACPECYLLVVRHATMHEGDGVQVIADEMPWVDIVTQTGALGDGSGHPEPARALWESGRVFVGPSGNRVVPGAWVALGGFAMIEGPTLPPWLIGVGGSSPECSGIEPLAGTPSDFVADFLQTLPAPNTTIERVPISGTSFSAPAMAGAMGLALLEIRRALGEGRAPGMLWSGAPRETAYLEDGNLSVAELREAFERSARYFDTTDFQPGCEDANQLSTPVPAPPAPWTKMGWGHVDNQTAAVVAALVLGEGEPEAKPDEAAAFMDAYMALRRAKYPE